MKLGKDEEALGAYERMSGLSQKPLGDDFATLALLHAGQAAGKLKQWDKAVTLFERAATVDPGSPYVPEALYETGSAQEQLGRLDDAKKSYAAVPTKTSREVAARAQFILGEILFQEKNYTEAIRTFYEVSYGGYDSPRWQADATYEAARCFEILKKNKTKPRSSIGNLWRSFRRANKASDAKRRLDVLEK